ncbi:MAG: indolepyruvate ferredoxin oxidoreductase family protein [Rhodobacter sp.]|nr:indolepyruvate ferredoxin oxidoreductase family protein [Rhodobacter sp.]
MRQDVSLADRFDLDKSPVLLNGTQALVRLMLTQKARDRAAGLDTAGYVSGYRGSPLGAVDVTMERARGILEASDIHFQPGINEDLAATAIWGTQQAELRGEGRFDGVFGLWYGKGPGVDRTGDVMRHANFAGTSRNGGVLMAMGDDHTGESSTTLHQSDWAMVDAYMPVLSPAGVQEILDYGLYGFALGRFAGLWCGLKLMKDTVETTAVVDGRPDRMSFVSPEFDMPDGGLNIRLIDDRIPQEARMIDYKRFAAEAFARANRIDRRIHGTSGAKIGFVAAGKNWLDLVHALSLLGIGSREAERLGLTTYKVAQTWPLDIESFKEWAEGLDLIVVVEEKRKLIEIQIKEAIFDDRRGRRVFGWHKGDVWRDGRRVQLFPTRYCLDPVFIAERIGGILIEEGRGTDSIRAGMDTLSESRKAGNVPDVVARLPYFCSGCPHNTSTKLPEGARAYAGIGCHFMVQWMDRETVGFTHMGGEGANWIGEAPFSTRRHVFQNIGDGTYNHSGVQAIRFALAAGTNVTYKILFNDAVAMTGGQGNDGGLTADRIARELVAMGVPNIALVYDRKEDVDLSAFPREVTRHERADLRKVQERLGGCEGVSAIIYLQTCAAEKRRRRRRGQMRDPERRVFINTDICEGCGDCGAQSNCVSIVPVETEFGRKRAIDQSACNRDFSCVDGFCPSFVTVEGAGIRHGPTVSLDAGNLPSPDLPEIDGTHNVVITGIGGTGAVTIGAVMAMAAHIDGKGAGMMEMAGLAQKGGAVHVHCRIANSPSDISAVRVAAGECDALIGGDLVVSAGSTTLGLTKTGRTGAVVNCHETITGDFTRDTEFTLPSERLRLALSSRLRNRIAFLDASELSRKLLGDAIYSNMVVFGAAWQGGFIPLGHEAIMSAIELNGTAADRNRQAFEYGRWAWLNPEEANTLAGSVVERLPKSLDERIDIRAEHLIRYQGAGLARRYRRQVDRFTEPRLREAVAKGYHRLLAYKDEYEVARLLLQTEERVRGEFDGEPRLTYHLAPPLLSRTGPNGRPAKREFGPWVVRLLRVLVRFRWLRGTPLDPFGHSAERRAERALIRQFETDMAALPELTGDRMEAAVALAELPLGIKGFGPVKAANMATAAKRRDELLTALHVRSELGQAAE